MLHLCPNCIFYREPNSLPETDSGMTSGEGEAWKEWQTFKEEKQNKEEQLVEEGMKIDYPPNFFPWCSKFTPGTEVLEKVKNALLKGNDKPYEEARENGMDFTIDPANGHVKPVFILCLRQNPTAECMGFKNRFDES